MARPSKGLNQGEVSLNLLHRDEKKGCILIRTYSTEGTIANPQEAMAEIAPFAGSISALEGAPSAGGKEPK